MFNNRQNAAFEELIKKEQTSRARWAANHGRTLAIKEGKIPESGLLIANEEFLAGRHEDYNGATLPHPDHHASQLLRTGKVVGSAQFSGSVEMTHDAEEIAYAKHDGLNKFTEHDKYQTQNPMTFTVNEYDANRLGIEDGNFPVVRKRIVKTVEVPVVKTVKVPIKMKGNHKDIEKAYHVVEEKYVDYEDKRAVREREVWVKRVVKEEYTKKVPVTKTRTKKVPLPPGTTYDVVPEAEADGYRIDTVEDVERVQVEEWADFELRPVLKSEPVPVKVHYPESTLPGTTFGAGAGAVGARTVRGIVPKSDPIARTTALVDTQPSPLVEHLRSQALSHAGNSVLSATRTAPSTRAPVRNMGTRALSLAATATLREQDKQTRARAARTAFQQTLSQRTNTHTFAQSLPIPPAATHNGPLPPRVGANAGAFASLSIQATTNSEKRGASVVSVHPMSPAAEAGLQTRDVITHVNNRPVKNAAELATAVDATDGAIVMDVLRGAIKTKVTVPVGKLPRKY